MDFENIILLHSMVFRKKVLYLCNIITDMKKKQSYLATGIKERITVIDGNTSEILSEETKRHTYIANSKEEFMLLYVNALPIFIDLSNPAKSTYAYLLSKYASETIFEIGGGTRSLIANRLGMSMSAIANGLTELKEAGLLYSPNKGMYQINPRYAFKGSTINRNAALKAIIELGCKDC